MDQAEFMSKVAEYGSDLAVPAAFAFVASRPYLWNLYISELAYLYESEQSDALDAWKRGEL